VRVRILSEGALDHGDTLDSKRAGERAARRAIEGEPDRKGAVTILVRRLLEEKLGREVKEWEMESKPLPRVNRRSPTLSGYEHKVRDAIIDARISGCTAVVVVVDRDGTRPGMRLTALADGRAHAERDGEALAGKTAIGVAVETVEAWLLADEAALNAALDPDPPAVTTPSPEQLDGPARTETHPKTCLRQLLDRSRREVSWPYDEIAERVRLDLLAARCPEGFAPFADEVKARGN
jgi:Domain of unknown function (DUF4276)